MATKKRTRKKKDTKVSMEADAAVAETSETSAKMDAMIEDPPDMEPIEDLGKDVKEEVQKAELSEVEDEIVGALAGTTCWWTKAGDTYTVYGTTQEIVRAGAAKMWRVLGKLRAAKKIDKLPKIVTEVTTDRTED